MERIALIDLGSNTARLVIYDVLDNGYFLVSEEHREAVRLGETEADGNLKQTRIMQSIATLKMFKEMCAIKNVVSKEPFPNASAIAICWYLLMSPTIA